MDTPATDTVAPSRSGGNLTYALLAIVIVVAAIFAFSTNALPDHWYAVFKTVHVILAVVWVGGGVLLTILGIGPSGKLTRAPSSRSLSRRRSRARRSSRRRA